MSILAITLILIAAFSHATWNFLSKRASGGTYFVWLSSAISTVIYLPFAVGIMLLQKPSIGFLGICFMLLSAVLHIGYFVLLNKGYQLGDLSLVYPIARGTGPVISIVVAILLLGERPSILGLISSLLIIAGVMVLANPFNGITGPDTKKVLLFAVTTGVFIASYTILDKYSVGTLLIPPILLNWAQNAGQSAMLTPKVLKDPDKIKEQWSKNLKEAVGVGILCPLSYILVLTVMVFTPVTYVAPAREVSILIGAFMGSRLLSEKDTKRRIIASAIILMGLIGLAV